jgi:hypothetical protein
MAVTTTEQPQKKKRRRKCSNQSDFCSELPERQKVKISNKLQMRKYNAWQTKRNGT